MEQETVGTRIKNLRISMEFTQTKFAQRIGITQAHLSNIENNKDSPSESVLRVIQDEFDISLKWLKTGQGDIYLSSLDIAALIDKLPEESRPNKAFENDLFHILGSNNGKIRTEFRYITSMFREIADSEDAEISKYGNLNIHYLGLILFSLQHCFEICSRSANDVNAAKEEKEAYFALGKITSGIIECKRSIAESLSDYQEALFDKLGMGKI